VHRQLSELVSSLQQQHGEPDGPHSEERPWHESSEFGGEDLALQDIPKYLLEGAVLWSHRYVFFFSPSLPLLFVGVNVALWVLHEP
jgi:hypothetical protein